jgi:hypothetical protein
MVEPSSLCRMRPWPGSSAGRRPFRLEPLRGHCVVLPKPNLSQMLPLDGARLSALTAQGISRLARRGHVTNWSNWRAAMLLGLISSSYSTTISQLAAAHIGRDAAVDWMSVAVIPGRDAMLQTEPAWTLSQSGLASTSGPIFPGRRYSSACLATGRPACHRVLLR